MISDADFNFSSSATYTSTTGTLIVSQQSNYPIRQHVQSD